MMQMFGHSVRRSVLILGAIEALTVYGVIFLVATLVVRSPYGPSGLTEAATLPALLTCLLYTSPSPRDRTRSRMPSSA